MNWTSSLAIYLLFWVMSAFFVMPFGYRAASEGDEPLVPGQVHSAPANFKPGLILIRITIVATIAFSLFYANYVQGWITTDLFDFVQPDVS
jgi:predicted secreted protein